MNVPLPPDLEGFVNERINSGDYAAPIEVVRDALLLLKERDAWRRVRLEELRGQVQVGVDQIDRGEYTSYTAETLPQLFDQIRQRGRQRLESEQHAAGDDS
jgi:antitoxin ParD1/3/4